MKISHCIVASNLNPYYLDLWPIVHKAWKEIVSVKAKLVLISKHIPMNFKHLSEDIYLFKPIKGIHTIFQAQCIRLLYPCIVETERSVIISDMDVLPMDEKFFVDNVKDIDNNKFVSYRNELIKSKQLAIMYNAATPKIWRDIFNIYNGTDIRSRLKEWYKNCRNYTGIPETKYRNWREFFNLYDKTDIRFKVKELYIIFRNYIGKPVPTEWFFDQKILYKEAMKWNKQTGNLVILNDKNTGFKRLDRFNLSVNKISQSILEKIKRGSIFTDYHMLIPYYKFKKENLLILKNLFSSRQLEA